jgi:antitoxin component YwqK of YwqJK toxin-antitoxin module
MPGFITTYVENGVKVTLHDGVRHSEEPVGGTGASRRYHPNGTLHAEATLEKGMTHGTVRTWHDNGQLASEAQHVYGTIRGITRNWHADGSLETELNYVLSKYSFSPNNSFSQGLNEFLGGPCLRMCSAIPCPTTGREL